MTLKTFLRKVNDIQKKSSPGPDGLPYEILYLVLKFPPYRGLITVVYNEALQKGKFPNSWNKSVMCLLYKKGDAAEIKNYRPLSIKFLHGF